MMRPLSLRVAILCTLGADDGLGRDALMLAHAVCAMGGQAHVVTDADPDPAAFAQLARDGLTVHRLGDALTGLAQSRFDWLVVAPPAAFHASLAAACGDFLRHAPGRVAVMHRMMPAGPHDPRLWDDARRLCLRGGLVLSASDAADRQARGLYAAQAGTLRFEVWRAPINTLAARGCLDVAKDGSILVILPSGATQAPLLAGIAPDLLAGRALRILGAEHLSASGRDAIEAQVVAAPGAQLEWTAPPSAEAGFRLMAAAQAVVILSEAGAAVHHAAQAAHAGTESLCLPSSDLVESGLAGVSHVAAGATPDDVAVALDLALRQPDRRHTLRAMVEPVFDFDAATLRLADILLRSAAAVAVTPPRPALTAIFGPYVPGAASPGVTRTPPQVTGCRAFGDGGLLVTVTASIPAEAEALRAEDEAGNPLATVWRTAAARDGERDLICHLMLPEGPPGGPMTITALRNGAACALPIRFQPWHVTPFDPWRPTDCAFESESVVGAHRVVSGWVVAQVPLGGLFVSPDGQNWFGVSTFTPRPKIIAKHPGYPAARCGFELRMPAALIPFVAAARLLCVARDGTALDLLTGWPPRPARQAASPVGIVA